MAKPTSLAQQIVCEKKPKLAVEEEEMLLRQERAEKEGFSIRVCDRGYFPFTTYEVCGAKKICYTVEIRSLCEKINSCSCPDHKVNTLGSCKHIEAVLQWIKNQKSIPDNSTLSPRVEIFLHTASSKARISWPAGGVDEVRDILKPYISVSEDVLIDPLMGTYAVEDVLQAASHDIAKQVHLSQHLIDWAKEAQHFKDLQEEKKRFLDDVEAGKRSLHILSSKLLPYQEEGVLHLAFKGRAILADEMGLGKTIQAIGACELLRRVKGVKKVLVITPASLKTEWEEQIARFSNLKTLLITGCRAERLKKYASESFFYLVNYEQVRSDFDEIQKVLQPDIMILDEAQRIKNWQTKTAWSVKQLKTPYAFVLTGTPIENRIEEIYSIMQVVDPKILGPLFSFQRDFYKLNEKGKAASYKNLDELHRKLTSVLLRRKKKDVEEQLPERTISNRMVSITEEQKKRYEDYSNQVARLLTILKKRPFTPDEKKKLQRLLACMRMVVDTPYILDPECKDCPKLEELEEILQELLTDPDCKIIIFSEWERMLQLVRELANRMHIDFAWHTGTVSQIKRREDINRFKQDPSCRLFLTTDSGSTGLNLQVANVVINLDLPWNPAKLEQRIARAWRKNQTRAVQVINLVAEQTIEHRMLTLLSLKQGVADVVLDAIGDGKDMPLPSASQQTLLREIDALINSTPLKPESSSIEKKQGQEPLKERIIARFSDRIHLIEKHKESVFIVVDQTDQKIRDGLAEVAANVEVLDLESYLTLKRLAKNGVITFGSTEKEVLFQSDMLHSNNQGNRSKQKFEQGLACYQEAEKKMKMALLLHSGGFSEEAFAPADQTLHKALEALSILSLDLPNSTSALQACWNDKRTFPECAEMLSSWMAEISTAINSYALGL